MRDGLMTSPVRPTVCLHPRGRGALGRAADTVVNVEPVSDMKACYVCECESCSVVSHTFQPQGL